MFKNIYKSLSILVLMISFSACVSNKNLKIDEGITLLKSMECHENALLSIFPSYGSIGDSVTISLANTAHKDEGLSIEIKNAIKKGNKSFAFYSKNNEKMSAILNAALFKFKDNELSNIHICYIGSKETSDSLHKEIQRTGAVYKNVK